MPIALGFGALPLLFVMGVPVFDAFFGFDILTDLGLMGSQEPSICAASILDTSKTSELVTVPLFILPGELLLLSGCITILFDAVDEIVGRTRGRQYIIGVLISVPSAALSGSAVAVPAMPGKTVKSEAMERGGDERLLAGLVLGGACIAPIIPPSVLIVLIGMQSGTLISALLAAGMPPGLVADLLFSAYIQFLLRRGPSRDMTSDPARVRGRFRERWPRSCRS